MKEKTKYIFLYLSIAIYALSFFLPTFGKLFGWTIFLLGVASLGYLSSGIFSFILWLANAFYILSVISFFTKRWNPKKLSRIAVVLAILFPLAVLLEYNSGKFVFGYSLYFVKGEGMPLKYGYWCWLLSFIILTYYFHLKTKQEKKE